MTACIEERFWNKVVKAPDGCWLWKAYRTWDGYGVFRFGKGTRLAHRVSLEWAMGPCPSGLEACHSCRNRHCVNPAHLRWDTRSANQADKAKDGALPDLRGEGNPHAKFTSEQVMEIRKAASEGVGMADIARQWGFGYGTIFSIVRRTRWKHLPSPEAYQ